MKEAKMRDQINTQVGPHLYTRYPVVLEHEGRQIAAFVHTKRVVRGKSIFHIEKLGKIRTPVSTKWAIFHYRLTRGNELADNGYSIITTDEAKEWIKYHKASKPIPLSD